jgi:hypothetical protein
LAEQMGVELGDRRVKLVAAVWASIVMTALADLGDDDTDWDEVGVDDVISRVDATFAEFIGLVGDIPQPV